MQKIVIILFVAASVLNASNLSGMKFCIDPGHGNYYYSEKPFETLMNMEVSLHFKEFLLMNGADSVVLTRTGNFGSASNPSLSERVAMANAAKVDWFQSVHHNAYNGAANYSLVLYREVNGHPTWQEAKDAGDLLCQTIYKALRTTAGYNRGDYSFLGYNLGVLSGLNMPGLLSEGSFFDYPAEIPRLQNCHYLRLEAWSFLQAYLDYFKVDKWSTGCIAGIVKDSNNVPLTRGSVWIENSLYSYQIDDIGNGFYAFINIPAGQYILYYRSPGKVQASKAITVTANTITFQDMNLGTDNYPNIVYINPRNGGELQPDAYIQARFSLPMDKTSTEEGFKIDGTTPEGNFVWTDDYTIVFTPSSGFAAGSRHTFTIGYTSKSTSGRFFDGNYNGTGGETGDDLTSSFTITRDPDLNNIEVLDEFEDNSGGWWDPEQSGSTIWTYPEKTYREISSTEVASGNYSMKLHYQFTNLKDGVCRLYRPQNLGPFQDEDSKDIGVWVYGDNSGNRLEFWFYTPSNQVARVYEYINFFGWRYLSVSLKDVPGSSKKFHSLVIRHNADKDYVGTVYFDKLLISEHKETGFASNKSYKKIPYKFTAQAYPNPFRDKITLKYCLDGERCEVSASLYDLTGKKIASIVKQVHSRGEYKIDYDAHSLATGIYILRVQAGKELRVLRLTHR